MNATTDTGIIITIYHRIKDLETRAAIAAGNAAEAEDNAREKAEKAREAVEYFSIRAARPTPDAKSIEEWVTTAAEAAKIHADANQASGEWAEAKVTADRARKDHNAIKALLEALNNASTATALTRQAKLIAEYYAEIAKDPDRAPDERKDAAGKARTAADVACRTARDQFKREQEARKAMWVYDGDDDKTVNEALRTIDKAHAEITDAAFEADIAARDATEITRG